MERFDGYILDKRIGDLLSNIKFLPVYVNKEFKKHFSDNAILASWIQWKTYPRDSDTCYIDYMFRKCCEFDKASKYLKLVDLDFNEDIGEWYCKIEKNMF